MPASVPILRHFLDCYRDVSSCIDDLCVTNLSIFFTVDDELYSSIASSRWLKFVMKPQHWRVALCTKLDRLYASSIRWITLLCGSYCNFMVPVKLSNDELRIHTTFIGYIAVSYSTGFRSRTTITRYKSHILSDHIFIYILAKSNDVGF